MTIRRQRIAELIRRVQREATSADLDPWTLADSVLALWTDDGLPPPNEDDVFAVALDMPPEEESPGKSN